MSIKRAITSYYEAMRKASEIVTDERADYLLIPMMGSVPFVDSMHVVDANFDPNISYFIPASSHLLNVNAVIKNWLDNFLEANVGKEDEVKILSIDEVVSGSSATRVNRAIQSAIKKRSSVLANELLKEFWTNSKSKFRKAAEEFDRISDFTYHDFMYHLIDTQRNGGYDANQEQLQTDSGRLIDLVNQFFTSRIVHKGISIEDSKNGKYASTPRCKEYRTLVEKGIIIPVPVETILTMDKPEYCPIGYERIKGASNSDYVRFNPIVTDVVISPQYLGLMKALEKEGKVGRVFTRSVSAERAKSSSDYLSTSYGGRYR